VNQPIPPVQIARLDPARDRVCGVLARHAADYPALTPLTASAWAGLEERDAAFAAGIYDAVVRRWLTLRWLVGVHAGRSFDRLDAPVKSALLAGAAQMMLLDRVPAHAAIDRAVEWAKAHGQGGGVVNAVLRKIAGTRERARIEPGPWDGARDALPLSDGRVMRLPGSFDCDERDWLAVATSHPRDLVDRWRAAQGEDAARSIALHGLVAPPVILYTGAASADPGPGGGLTLLPHDSPRHHVAQGPRAALLAYLERRPDVWVQDPGASAAIDAVRGLAPRLIVDACAGRGTKTRQLAAVFPNARVLATDVDDARRAELARLATPDGRIRVVIPAELARAAAGQADLVVLDVPCSNSGTLARRVEARYRFERSLGRDQLARLAAIQADLIRSALGWLAPDGAILYSTCSIEPEENEGRIGAIPPAAGLVRDSSALALPAGVPGEAPSGYRDGGYWCLLRRRGTVAPDGGKLPPRA